MAALSRSLTCADWTAATRATPIPVRCESTLRRCTAMRRTRTNAARTTTRQRSANTASRAARSIRAAQCLLPSKYATLASKSASQCHICSGGMRSDTSPGSRSGDGMSNGGNVPLGPSAGHGADAHLSNRSKSQNFSIDFLMKQAALAAQQQLSTPSWDGGHPSSEEAPHSVISGAETVRSACIGAKCCAYANKQLDVTGSRLKGIATSWQ